MQRCFQQKQQQQCNHYCRNVFSLHRSQLKLSRSSLPFRYYSWQNSSSYHHRRHQTHGYRASFHHEIDNPNVLRNVSGISCCISKNNPNNRASLSFSSSSSTSSASHVRLGHVERRLNKPNVEELVPRNYLLQQNNEEGGSIALPNSTLQHLQWMLTKDNLNQDMLLVGPPGSGSIYRRRLAMMYAEMTNQEVEILTLSSDITESDLKQRRELVVAASSSTTSSSVNSSNSTKNTTTTTTTEVQFIDQPPVRAALHGRILILDGLDKAERNVLPTLNNLLENREMNLEDGRFLVSPERYQELLSNHNTNNGNIMNNNNNLVSTHSNFRVIALAVPVPPYNNIAGSQSLDPPLRSRFQIRRVNNPLPEESYEELMNGDNNNNREPKIAKFCTLFANALEVSSSGNSSLLMRQQQESTVAAGRSLHFPMNTMRSIAEVLHRFPFESPSYVLSRAYPYTYAGGSSDESRKAFHQACVELDLVSSSAPLHDGFTATTCTPAYEITNISPLQDADPYHNNAQVRFSPKVNNNNMPPDNKNNNDVSFMAKLMGRSAATTTAADNSSNRNSDNDVVVTLPCGANKVGMNHDSNFVQSDGSKSVLLSMMQEHYSGRDILLLSPKGEGKSVTAMEFASMLGYDVQLFSLYQEMTARDLLMRRVTDPKTGATGWDESPLIKAAISGHIVILDGIEKLSPDTLGTLQGFLTDREICLPDGRKLIGNDRLSVTTKGDANNLSSNIDESDNSSGNSGILQRIHPSFRVIGLGSIPSPSSSSSSSGTRKRRFTINEEMTSMFSTIVLPTPGKDELKEILSKHNTYHPDDFERILKFHSSLTSESAANCGVSPLSTRNLLRLVKRGGSSSSSDLYTNICSILVAELLPPVQRSTLESLLKKSDIHAPSTSKRNKRNKRKSKQRQEENDEKIVMDEEYVSIGEKFKMKRKHAERKELVPSPRFYDIPNHVRMIRTLLAEWYNATNKERAFLLLGNQGVGKNKIVDRICEISNFEREYIQLHRDSTIGQLTISPTLENGRIVWRDSPLVRAVKYGRSLVIDEADKAPLEVISVLKSLVEDGELSLADGRRISRNSTTSTMTNDDDDNDNNKNSNHINAHNNNDIIIPIHPDFTVWVLANRPGFPFHGNDFFHEIGDCFSSHVIPNPDLESEIHLLQSYGPNVDIHTLRQIAASFADLRFLFDSGDITYPYSTREAVSIVKHLERYPEDDIVHILHNVLDMDTFNYQIYNKIIEVFRNHGIPIENYIRYHRGISTRSTTDGNGLDENKHQMGKDLKIEYITDRSTEGKSLMPPPLSDPKFGKWDEKNEAHVGGNSWAGGTGGSNTAGLGGRGGPFRLDRGHKVHQVSDEAKAAVSKEAAEKVRKIAERALKERLKEIGMSEHEHEMYDSFTEPIKGDISSLRSMLQSVESKISSSQRDWIKRQSYGELDDSKLIEGVSGERYIYKRRGKTDRPQTRNLANKKPRRLRFVMDCSGSMYRFNGYDNRMNRSLEATALIMESFVGTENRFDYSIVGHSGDRKCIELVNFGKPPKNAKERLQVLQTMVAHSQFCQSGDNTLGAIRHAVKTVAAADDNQSANEYDYNDDDGEDDEGGIVIAISDANLARYGISAQELARVMTPPPLSLKTRAYCIFIASFGEEALEVQRDLPLGRGFICMETSELPQIVRNVLSAELHQ